MPPLTGPEIDQLLEPIMPEKNRQELAAHHDTDFAYEIPGLARFRMNAFADRRGPGAVIRVIPAESEAPLDLGRAFLRTLMWVLLAVPAGLGFLSALVSRDHRGLHDRFAGTRVVRASA